MLKFQNSLTTCLLIYLKFSIKKVKAAIKFVNFLIQNSKDRNNFLKITLFSPSLLMLNYNKLKYKSNQ